MANETLSKDLILDSAETVLRKYGSAKTNMSDIARALGVTHAALYRHYENKASLWNSVVERWIHGVFAPLEAFVTEKAPSEERLYRYIAALCSIKRERARKDPELFAMYAALFAQTEGVLDIHAEDLLNHLTSIIEEGIASGAFACKDARRAALAVFLATTRFHHASHAHEWESPDSDSRFEAVWELILNGLISRP